MTPDRQVWSFPGQTSSGLCPVPPDAGGISRAGGAPADSVAETALADATAAAVPSGPAPAAAEPGPPAVAAGGVVARGGPLAARIVLGVQLRRLREENRVSVMRAARTIRATQSKISRLERGRSGPKLRDIADLLSLYGVSGGEREPLMALARQANAPGWWREYSDVVPAWFELYLGLERTARFIHAYEVQFIHGLLQTEDYARAVIRIGRESAPAAQIERRVNVRMQRQELLTQPNPAHVWAVLDEASLRRSPSRPDLMRRQLEWLLHLAELPNVTVQVVPFGAGSHAAAGGPFTILRFAEPALPDLVYLEQLSSAVYLDGPGEIGSYLAVMNQLGVQAETETASRLMIEGLLRET